MLGKIELLITQEPAGLHQDTLYARDHLRGASCQVLQAIFALFRAHIHSRPLRAQLLRFAPRGAP